MSAIMMWKDKDESDVQRTSGGEGGDKLRAALRLRTRNTTITRGEKDGSSASAELGVRIAEVTVIFVRTAFSITSSMTYFANEREIFDSSSP